MEIIGFKNFRRFREFPEKKLAPITMLVGGNNSGKSTLVKGAILMYNFLQTKVSDVRLGRTLELSLDVTEPFDIHIGTQGRAKTKSAPSEEGMEFSLGIGGMTYRICTLGGDVDFDKTSTKVVSMEVEDTLNGMRYVFENDKGRTRIIFPGKETDAIDKAKLTDRESELKKAQHERNELAHSNTGDLNAIVKLNDTIAQLQKEIDVYRLMSASSESKEVSIPLVVYYDSTSDYYIFNLLRGILTYANTKSDKDKRTSEYKEETNIKNILQTNFNTISESIDRVAAGLGRKSIEYIFAHSATQNLFYNSKDKNDYIADTVHQYAKAKINQGDEFHRFVIEWMGKDKLDIGSDFKVIPHGGEAYELEITNHNGDVVPLADKGMGSIQLMILLLRIATLAKKYNGYVVSPTVFIEEPEQNLHPKLQSRLADLWDYVNDTFGMRFIIETHSEYMIRKSQILVAQKQYSDIDSLQTLSPFKVYYFSERECYEMVYRTDGRFANKFGEGFYDEATSLAFEII